MCWIGIQNSRKLCLLIGEPKALHHKLENQFNKLINLISCLSTVKLALEESFVTKTITVSDELYAHLESLARPFLDREPQDVILRLIEGEAAKSVAERDELPKPAPFVARVPRERGAVVELNGNSISADTVRDLFEKVMEYIYMKGYWSEFEALAPYKTSSKRYLIATSPKHPSGQDFVVPVSYRNLYMEAHKSYKTAINQLKRLLSRLSIALVYRGS